jgi:hypothetical protein
LKIINIRKATKRRDISPATQQPEKISGGIYSDHYYSPVFETLGWFFRVSATS